jgi:hypothetical protein
MAVECQGQDKQASGEFNKHLFWRLRRKSTSRSNVYSTLGLQQLSNLTTLSEVSIR